jgi:hypothetical protein
MQFARYTLQSRNEAGKGVHHALGAAIRISPLNFPNSLGKSAAKFRVTAIPLVISSQKSGSGELETPVTLATDSGRITADPEAIHLAAGYFIAIPRTIYVPFEYNS